MNQKSTKQKIWFTIFLIIDIFLVFWALSEVVFPHWTHSYGVMQPQGIIADQQKRLILTAIAIMMVPALLILGAGFYIIFKYRDTKDTDYKEQPLNPRLQIAGWIFLILVIICLSVLNFRSTHELDPSRELQSTAKPITIQVVALEWKWLFIYPEQNIATVNYINIPKKVPVHFELTADQAPMNLFWIPQLGGQMSAMAGMVNKLNLMADQTGQFQGSASEINGEGFAGMKFTVNSTSKDDFNKWVTQTKKSSLALTEQEYNKLSAPSKNNPTQSFSSVAPDLYNGIIIKYMSPSLLPTSTKPSNVTEMHM